MKIEFPKGDWKALIFDCDGTLAHTMPLHYRAWCRAMEDFGGQFPEKLFYEFGGMPTAEIVRRLNEKYQLAMPVDGVVARKEAYYLELVHETEPIEAVVTVAREYHGRLPMAVASGGHRHLVEASLNALGIRELFDTIVAAEDYIHGKPAPDPFLEAARRLEVTPEHCLVFEDGLLGVEAAKAAGMGWVFVDSAPVLE